MSIHTMPLSQGKEVIVDEDDYSWLIQWKWLYKPSQDGRPGYAICYQHKKVIYMHRLIMSAPSHSEIDHINGNPLDNRRFNLRLATRQENSSNQSKRRYNKGAPTSSRYKGVTKGRTQKWEAQIKVRGRRKHLGSFMSEVEAARAYDSAAREYFGDFARPNFPSTDT